MAVDEHVHGARRGGWCRRRAAPRLRAAGHEVYAPPLPGLGERAHLRSPAVDPDTHAADVLGVLVREDLRGVVLVGHSDGGMVIAAVGERGAGRLARLVYLDAFLPPRRRVPPRPLPPGGADVGPGGGGGLAPPAPAGRAP